MKKNWKNKNHSLPITLRRSETYLRKSFCPGSSCRATILKMMSKKSASIFQNYHFFENAETKLFQNWPMFCPILWYSQMICHDTITLCYQTKVTMIAGVISILTYIVLRSRKGQKFFFLTNKAKFAHHFLLIDSPIYIYTFFL